MGPDTPSPHPTEWRPARSRCAATVTDRASDEGRAARNASISADVLSGWRPFASIWNPPVLTSLTENLRLERQCRAGQRQDKDDDTGHVPATR